MMGNDLSVVQNSLSTFGLRVVHVMDAEPIGDRIFSFTPKAADGAIKTVFWKDEIGFYHGVITWKSREVIRILKSSEDPAPIWGVMWWLGTNAAIELARAEKEYCDQFEKKASFKITRHEIPGIETLLLPWVPEEFVVLCDVVPEQTKGSSLLGGK